MSDDFDAAASARARRRRREERSAQRELELDRCVMCNRPGDLLCDGVLDGGTCDAVLCRRCAFTPREPLRAIVCSRGRGKGRGCQHVEIRSDFCPACVEAGRARGQTPSDRV